MLGLLQDGCHQAYYAKQLCYCHWQGQWSALCSQKSIDLLNAAQQTQQLYECLEINKIFSFTLQSPISLVLHKP